MRPLEALPADLVAWCTAQEKRLLDLERRVVPKPPRTLDDLDDVEVLYDSTTDAPVDNEALVWDATRSLWVPGPAGGSWATAKVFGTWVDTAGGTFGSTVSEWSAASGLTAPTVATGGGNEGLTVSDAGVWAVTLEVYSSGAAITSAVVSGDPWSLNGDGDCLPNSAGYVGSAVERVTVADHFALPDGATVIVSFDGTGSIEWRLAVHYVGPLDVVAGSCGG